MPIILILLLLLTNYSITTDQISSIILNPINNVSLNNGLLIIHPICIYLTYILLFVNFSETYKITKFVKYFNFFKKKNSKIFFFISYFSFTAIFLGSHWAQQELNWGGWWNWDYVELIALVFFIMSIYFVHSKKNNIYQSLTSKYSYVIFVTLFYVVVRCDLLNSVHSFNSFRVLDKYIQYVYIIVLIVYLYCISKNLNFFKVFIFRKTNLKRFNIFFNFFNKFFLMILMFNLIRFYYNNDQISSLDFFLKTFIYYMVFLYISYSGIKRKYDIFIVLLFITSLVINNNIFIYISLLILVVVQLFSNNIFSLNWKIMLKFTHIIIVLMFLTSLNNTPVFKQILNNYYNSNYMYFNNFYLNSFENFSLTNVLSNVNYINNFSTLNNSLNWNVNCFLSINTNLIQSNSFITYNLNDAKIFVYLHCINIIFLYSLILNLVFFYFFKKINYRSDIV